MPTNRWLYDLSTEWRRWRGQQGKLLLLICGFALVCALTALVLRLGSLLFLEAPHWLKTPGHYYTMANKNDLGQLQGLNRQSLQVLADTPGVTAVSWLAPQTQSLEFAGQTLADLQLMFFAPEWFNFTGITQANDEQGIWLSDRYWRTQFQANPAVIGQYLHHKKIPHGLQIKGVLPASADRIGHWQPDLWLSGDHLRYLTPFTVDSTKMVDRFLLAVPWYYAVFRTAQQTDPAALTERLNSLDLTVPGMRMESSGYQLAIFAGVNLDPVARQRLAEQWELLLLLVVGLGVVLTLNLFTVYASRLVMFQDELQLFRVLGANRIHLLRPVCLSAMLLTALIAALAWLCCQLLGPLIAADPAYQAISASSTMQIALSQFLAATGLILLLLLLAGCLPLLRLEQQPLFSRAMNPGRTALQKLVAQLNLALQLLVALLALNTAGTLGYNLWQSYQNNALPADLIVLDASHQGSGLDLSAIANGSVPGLAAQQIAWASADFINPSTFLLDAPQLPHQLVIGRLWVSASYFNLLGKQVPTLPAVWQNGVVINQTLADLLSKQLGGKAVLGSAFSMDFFNPAQPIIAIVPDLPHQGRSGAAVPMAYLPMHNAGKRLQLYLHNESIPALTRWLSEQMTEPRFQDPRHLVEIVASQDRARWQLLFSALAVVILILLSVFISLSYQIKARLELERHEYGVLLAIGAPDSYLHWRTVRQALLALTLAMPFVLALQSLLLQWGRSAVGSNLLFEPAAFIGAATVLTLLVLLCCHWPLRLLLRQPIYQVLRQQH